MADVMIFYKDGYRLWLRAGLEVARELEFNAKNDPDCVRILVIQSPTPQEKR